MSCWAVIPIKPPPDRKTRLAGSLDVVARNGLVRRMAAHVVAAAAEAQGLDEITLLTGAPTDVPTGVRVLADAGYGLNPALVGALAQVAAAGGSRAVIVAGDLPLVTAEDIALLATLESGVAGIAPDRHGVGTNALSLPLPHAADFRFTFGPDSFARHRAEMERLRLEIVEVRCEGLARDVDLPEDLIDAAALLDNDRAQVGG